MEDNKDNAIKFAEWIWVYCSDYMRPGLYYTIEKEWLTIGQLYDLFNKLNNG